MKEGKATAAQLLGDLEGLYYDIDDYEGDDEGTYQVECKIRALKKQYDALTPKEKEEARV